MLENISENLIIIFVLCAITIVTVCVPLVLFAIHDAREARDRKYDKQAERDARTKREDDLCVLLGNILKTDVAMDYVFSRGDNSESRFDRVINVIQGKTEEPKE